MMSRLIVGNWKMHNTIPQAEALIRGILEAYHPLPSVEVGVAPPFVALQTVSQHLKNSSIKLVAQNVHEEEEGAFTGEVSPAMLHAVGCQYVIVGHSERRHVFGETDETINKKVHAVLRHGLFPILCVGERLEERENNQTQAVIQQQLQEGLTGITETEIPRITIAYEPVWAIGTGRAATVDQAAEVHRDIRQCLHTCWGTASEAIRILYGGSVSPDNASTLFQSHEINGVLIGKACLNSESFVRIVNSAV